MNVSIVPFDQSVDFAVSAWLDAKAKRSQSVRTYATYKETIDSFRQWLHAQGWELDSPPTIVSTVAQAWAGHSLRGKEVSASTYNTRLAILSSFYAYCGKMEYLSGKNPIRRVERRVVQEYASAEPLSPKTVKEKLQAIDRHTVRGSRDYALLLVALSTGRRLSEIANMRWSDIDNPDGHMVITWHRTKGGKVMKDRLSLPVSEAIAWWKEVSPHHISEYVWTSLANNASYSEQLSIRALSNICQKRLGTSKFHALRHTFAHVMEDLGAKVSVIQQRLGHSSIATTGKYLQSLSRDENEFADALADVFGA